jgi:DNA (cytosine-5)-methyltransferase 1
MTKNQPFAFRNGTSDAETRPAVLDLFCGVGGLSLGFLMGGFRVQLAIDNDPNAVGCYNKNLKGKCDAGAVLFDLSKIKSHEQIQDFLKSNGKSATDFAAVVGGPPCQGFTTIGRTKLNALIKSADSQAKRKVLEKRDRQRCALFETFALFVEVIKPKWFFFENVPTIRNHKMYKRLILRFDNLKSEDGTKLEYTLTPNIYTASGYGVPQTRQRFILVGRLPAAKRFIPPRKRRLPNTVSDALSDLPRITAGARKGELKASAPAKGAYQKLMRSGYLPDEPQAVHDHICRSHVEDDIRLFRQMKQGERFADERVRQLVKAINPKHHLCSYSVDNFTDKLHRLEGAEPAWTITAHLQKDGYKFIHHRQGRTISVREAARLQSFPDWFRFSDLGMGSAFRLIGNAVPPLMARAFARQILALDCGGPDQTKLSPIPRMPKLKNRKSL